MNLPNKLSILRICLVPLFVVAYFLPYYWGSFVAVAIFVIAAVTDFLDGYIARKYDLVTDLGKLLDPIADKILICAALFCVVATNPLQYKAVQLAISVDYAGDFGQIFLAVGGAIIIARELLVSAVRQIAASKGVVVQANIYGKVKTVAQDMALPMLVLLYAPKLSDDVYSVFFDVIWIVSVVLFGVAILMTLVSGIVYIVQNKKVFAD